MRKMDRRVSAEILYGESEMRKMDRQVSAEIVYKDELPYRISIGGSHGMGHSPKSATIAALIVGRLIPSKLRYDEDAILNFLERNYEDSSFRNILINIIKSNSL